MNTKVDVAVVIFMILLATVQCECKWVIAIATYYNYVQCIVSSPYHISTQADQRTKYHCTKMLGLNLIGHCLIIT